MMKPPQGIPAKLKDKAFRHAWAYSSEDGTLLGYVARFDGQDGAKDCVPYFHENDGKWSAGALPEPRPLFGLESLPVNTTADVYICEGEKCAAAIHSLGLPCVCSIGGAQAADKGDWTPLEHFRRIVILPDNDVSGKRYVLDVARCLAALPGGREVSIANLPDLPPHGDVVDYVDRHASEEWDGYGPIPRQAGDDLTAQLLEVIEGVVEPVRLADIEPASDGQDDWGEPVPLDPVIRPAWPPNVFPEPVQEFVDALAASTETPIEMPALMTLAVLATAAHGKFRVRVKPDYSEPLCVWTCVALPSGSRKSAVLDSAALPLHAWEDMRRIELEPRIRRATSERETMKARVAELRKKAARARNAQDVDQLKQETADAELQMPDVPRLPQLWTGDCTPEKLAVIMADNDGCMSILSDEGGIFDTIAGRYSSGIANLDVYLQGHAGSAVRVNRVGRDPIILNAPCLSIGLCPQPDVIRALHDKPAFRGRGLLARFLYAHPPSNVGRRVLDVPSMPDAKRQAYAATVKAMLSQPWAKDAEGRPCAHELTLCEHAQERYSRFAKRIEGGMREGAQFAHIPDWAGKLPGAVVRIAGVLHVARYADAEPSEHPISCDDMDAATRMGDALAMHALMAFDSMGVDVAFDDARALLNWIRREALLEFTQRDAMHKNQSRFRRAEEIKPALEILEERGYIRRRPAATGNPGRPSAVFDVNPLLEKATIQAAA